MERNIISNLTQVGRAQIKDPNLPNILVTHNADFSGNASIEIDFTTINQADAFGVIKSIFVDNGSNPSIVEVSVSGTDQFFTVPAYAIGVYSVDANQSSKISFDTEGGATDIVTLTFYNWERYPSVWYRFGAFNKDAPIKTQGTNENGVDINAASENNPVYIAGRSNVSNSLMAVSVDETGRLRIIGAAVGGNIFGTDDDGAPITAAPVLIAGNNGGDAKTLTVLPSGELLVTTVDAKQPANSSNVSTVAATAASANILAANANRRGALIFNNSTSVMNLLLDAGDAETSFSIAINPFSSFVLNDGDYVGEINAAWISATGNAKVTEFTHV